MRIQVSSKRTERQRAVVSGVSDKTIVPCLACGYKEEKKKKEKTRRIYSTWSGSQGRLKGHVNIPICMQDLRILIIIAK